MKLKPLQIYFIVSFFFIIDGLYYLGYVNLIDLFIDYAIGWFFTAFIGFTFSYYLLHKTDIRHKAILNVIITIGLLINLVLIALWYILKDFNF